MSIARVQGPEVTDVEGKREDRAGRVSVSNGPTRKSASRRLQRRNRLLSAAGCRTFLGKAFRHRSWARPQISRAEAAVRAAGLRFRIVDNRLEPAPGHASIGTMHLAKGLEFRAVAVMACGYEVVRYRRESRGLGTSPTLRRSMRPSAFSLRSVT